MDEAVRQFLERLLAGEGVSAHAQQILASYRQAEELAMSKDKDKGSSQTDEPWKAPQPPDSKSPPKRDPEKDYAGDKAQTS
jgi:hypothetical protein